jgi:anaerobic ribonucleoside-triphosphate reductase activating protein
VAALASEIKIRNLSVVVFSGYTIEEIQSRLNPAAQQLLSVTDILIDGRYLKDQPDTKRRWIGSTNQRIHFLTDRYKPNDSYWQKSNTLEIRVSGNELSVNGFPSIGGKALWRRPKPLSE